MQNRKERLNGLTIPGSFPLAKRGSHSPCVWQTYSMAPLMQWTIDRKMKPGTDYSRDQNSVYLDGDHGIMFGQPNRLLCASQ